RPTGGCSGMREVRAVVLAALRRRRGTVVRLAAWSIVEALPGLLAGVVTARAVDRGFLAGRPAIGLAWLATLAVAVLPGAVAARRTYGLIGALVEAFRDEVLRRVVAGALHGVASARPDTGAVARLTQQVEIVR